MKKLCILTLAIILATMSSCKKKSDESSATLDNKDLVAQIFSNGMNAYSSAMNTKGSTPLNFQIDKTINGPAGGYCHITGSLTGNITWNDQTGQITGGTALLGFTHTYNNYAFTSNDNTYTINGDPYVSWAGTFTFGPNMTFGTASSISIGGAVKVSGPNVSKSVDFNVSIIINSSGTGGHVSGTVGGVALDYYF
jgi:hypothetical protein